LKEPRHHHAKAGLIGSALNCSFAQRLIRRICPKCKKEYKPDEKLIKSLGLPLDTRFFKGEGCEFCSGIGYRGRVGIYEILQVNQDIRRLIAHNAPENEIRDVARKFGMKSLYEDGLLKVKEEITTLEELQKVIMVNEVSE
jgi:type II secretory ATPase GspE/PulE/Tfp pilus assembly ATPase PilB-like protein